mgnify:CR=1 FL=1
MDRIRSLSLAAFWLSLAGAVVLALLPTPPAMPTDQFGDKFNHMLAFAVMTALALAAYPQTPRLRIVERLSFLGALIEVGQSIPALHRDCDIRDWIADSLSILAVVAIAALIGRWRKARAAR